MSRNRLLCSSPTVCFNFVTDLLWDDEATALIPDFPAAHIPGGGGRERLSTGGSVFGASLAGSSPAPLTDATQAFTIHVCHMASHWLVYAMLTHFSLVALCNVTCKLPTFSYINDVLTTHKSNEHKFYFHMLPDN